MRKDIRTSGPQRARSLGIRPRRNPIAIYNPKGRKPLKYKTRPILKRHGIREPDQENPDVESHELYLYATTHTDLYHQREVPIIKNLLRKLKRNTYQHDKALTLWKYWADDAAQRYTKEHDARGATSYGVFTVADSLAVAKERADYFLREYKLGNYSTMAGNPGRTRRPLRSQSPLTNNPHPRGRRRHGTLIYGKVLEIRAEKTKHPKYRGQRFRHKFSSKSAVQCFGQLDGSLVIRSATGARLWAPEGGSYD